MVIANFKEYIEVLNNLFDSTLISDVEEDKDSLKKARQEKKAKLDILAHEIKVLNSSISDYRIKIAQSDIADKKKLGILFNKYKSRKMDLVRKYGEQKNSVSFSELKVDDKIHLCTISLLKKYLTKEIKANPYFIKERNNQGIVIDTVKLQESELYQNAGDIKDYVESYIANYPKRVDGAKYFIGRHKNAESLTDLLKDISKYNEEINAVDMDRIVASKEGIERVAVFADKNIQAVKVLSKNALKYEAKAMQHCVSSYWSKVEKGETEIYSIRDIGSENKEAQPHATIEFKNGKIVQIRGMNNKSIYPDYIDATRKLVMELTKAKDFDDVINDDNINIIERNNIGIYKDVSGKAHDIFNLVDNGVKFDRVFIDGKMAKIIPLSKMSIGTLEVVGTMDQEDFDNLILLDNVKKITFKDIDYEGELIDFSKNENLKYLRIDFRSANNIKEFIFNDNTQMVSISGDFPNLIEFQWPKKAVNIELGKSSFPKLKSLDFSHLSDLAVFSISQKENSTLEEIKLHDNLKKLCLYGVFNNLKDINFPLNLQLLNISNCYLPQIKSLDLIELNRLKSIEFLSNVFENLENIRFPTTIENMSFDHNKFLALRELDLSNLCTEEFGKREVRNLEFILSTGEEKTINPEGSFEPILKGMSFSFNQTPNLESIKFNPELIELSLIGNNFSKLKSVNLQDMEKLKKLDISFGSCSPDLELNFAENTSLKEMVVSHKHLKNIIPKSLETLNIYPSTYRSDEQMSDDVYDLRHVNGLKKIWVDGIYMENVLVPESVVDFTYSVIGKKCDGLEILDFSKYEKSDIKLSVLTTFNDLKTIRFSREFGGFILFKKAPLLAELDFSKVDKDVIIGDISNFDVIIPNNAVVLNKEQFPIIERISLGKGVSIELLGNACFNPDMIVEFHPETNQEIITEFRQKNADIKIFQHKKEANNLLLCLMDMKKRTN